MICPPKHTKEWQDLVSAVGTFEAYRDWAENNYTIRDPQVVRAKLIKLMYQGFNEPLDDREFNYFTGFRNEAKDYGATVRELDIDTTGFLHRDDKYVNDEYIPGEYGKATREFKDATGKTFDILDNSPEGLEIQREFFRFLKAKGYKGFDSSGGEENNYVVTFGPTIAYNRSETPLANYKRAVGLTRLMVAGENLRDIKFATIKYNKQHGSTYKPVFRQVGQSNQFTYTLEGGSSPGEQLSAFSRLSAEEMTNPQLQDNLRASEEVYKLISSLKRHFPDLRVESLTPEQAASITAQTSNPWNGEAMFFLGDTIYYVGDHLTTNMVLHEFAHPIFRSMWKNPKSAELFNRLYNDLSATSEGRDIISTVESLYPELTKDSEFFKEEVLVRALAHRADDLRSDTKNSSGFLAIIKRILYHIKQLLRKLFKSSIKPENLDVNTTLDELAAMLLNDEFKIDTVILSQNDIASYIREYNKLQDEIYGAGVSEKMQSLLKKLYDTTLRDKVRALENENYPEMLKLIQDEFELNILSDIRKNIYKYKDEIASKIKDDIERNTLLQNQAKSFISSLYQLEVVTKNLLAEMDTIKSSQRSKEDVLRVQYIMDFTRYWEDYLTNNRTGVKQQLLNEGLSSGSELIKLIDTIGNNIVKTKHNADPIIKEGIELLLTDVLKHQSEWIDKTYTTHLANLKSKNASPALIKAWEDEYERLRMKPGKIKAMMSGMGDAGYINNMLEGWMYSSDEIVGGMGAFFKTTHNNIQTAVQSRFNDFLNEIIPLAKDAGVDLNKLNFSDFTQKLLFTDTKGIWEDDQLVKQEVFTFLNPHKDYRWDVADLNNRIRTAEETFERTSDSGDELILSDLRIEKQEQDKHFWREYKDVFYQKDEIFNSPAGQRAKLLRDNLFQQINDLQRAAEKEGDLIDVRPGDSLSPARQIEELRKQLRQLYSLKDLNDEYKTGEDLQVAQILQESREINRSFYQYDLTPGKFQKLLSRYEQEMVNSGIIPGSKEFNDKRQEWLDLNTVQAVLPEFYQMTRDIYDQIKAIYESIVNPSQLHLDLAATYKEITDTLSGYRDDDGQPIGSDMSAKTIAKIKNLQQKADRLQKEIRSGLSMDEQQELEDLLALTKKRGGPGVDLDQSNRISELLSQADKSGLSKWQRAELSNLWTQLAELQGKEPTEYYLDVFNNFLEKLPEELKEQLIDLNKTLSIDKNSADYVINLPAGLLKDILKSVPGFEQWFKDNHLRKEIYDPAIKAKRKIWQRVASWSIIRPLSPEYMERTSILDLDGNVSSIEGKPSLRFYERSVKPEFNTEKIIGVTVDVFDKFLPRSQAQGAPSDKYVNQRYYDLQRDDPKLFKTLEKIKELYLDFQKDADKYARLGYDFPRIRKRYSEEITTGKIPSTLTTFWTNFKDFFRRAKDDPDSGLNLRDEIRLTEEPYFDSLPNDKPIPVTGIYNLPVENVSLDLFHGIAQYMAGVERQKQLKEILPFFKATHDVLTDPSNAIRNVEGVEQKNMMSQYLNRPVKGGTNRRAEALLNKMQREFYGQTTTGLFPDSKGVNGVINAAFRGASFSYLAVNIPAAIANMSVQILQNVIRSASGEQFTPAELIRGSVWAVQTSAAIAAEIHRSEAHSLPVQLTEIFDPIPGRYLQTSLGRSQGRSWLRDFASFSWLYSPRKFMENYATLEAFGAMMDHVRIKQTIDGQTKEIKYIDAWKLVDNKITLLPGIDLTYAPGGKEFNRILNYMQHVQHDMNGAYDGFSQPEAYRHLIYRLYSFLRRYVTTMLTNRFAPTRLSPGMMTARTGFYYSVGKMLWRTVTMDPKALTNMSPQEQSATRQFLTEIGLVTLMWFMYGLFGWDPDDEDKYTKLREKSGPLPLPFVPETEYPFQADGWLSNHALLQLLKVKSQTEMWIPLPNMGLKDYTSLASAAPIVWGPTIDLGAKMVDNVVKIAQGDERAYYQRTIGPFQWQEEGDPKVLNYIGQLAGMRGATVTPELAIQKQEQARVLK